MKAARHLLAVITATLCLLPVAHGQRIEQLRLPADLCGGATARLTVGFSPDDEVVISAPRSALGHHERIFLPDGDSCGAHGCSYQSPVTFTAFRPGARVNSVEDILYVRLNIEHSYIGDIYVNITCPNGQSADLMKKHEIGQSPCTRHIARSSFGWADGDNAQPDTFFGLARNTESAAFLCDSAAEGNEPGMGWNYCWSNNTTAGYRYAPGDALVYRAANAVRISQGMQVAIDSSNVALGRNFYHPDDSFSRLIGCPLNGDWYIEVMDGYSIDNGYLFEWELALDPSLLPTECLLADRLAEGPYLQRTSDSTFVIAVPDTLAHDCKAEYHFRLVNSCGDTVDTTATIRLHPSYRLHADTAACRLLLWNGAEYRTTTTLDESHTTRFGCDSLVHLDLRILDEDLEARIAASPTFATPTRTLIRLHDGSTGSTGRLWLLPGGDTSRLADIAYDYPAREDSVAVGLIAFNAAGCPDTAQATLTIDRHAVWPPNAFTPDLETNSRWSIGTNDIATLEVWIYDRQGRQVAHLEGTGAYWDGTCDGRACPQGNYVYRMRYSTRVRPTMMMEGAGSILLIR